MKPLEILCPSCSSLWGIASIKWELEDLSFRYLEEAEFYRIRGLMNEKRTAREALVAEVIGKLQERVEKAGVDAEILRSSKTYLFYLS